MERAGLHARKGRGRAPVVETDYEDTVKVEIGDHEASKFTVGWISSMPAEARAAHVALNVAERTITRRSDENLYREAYVEGNWVVVGASGTGLARAANMAANMARSFPRIRDWLVVGIGGSIPSYPVKYSTDAGRQHIALGDVVISKPVANQPGNVNTNATVLTSQGPKQSSAGFAHGITTRMAAALSEFETDYGRGDRCVFELPDGRVRAVQEALEK